MVLTNKHNLPPVMEDVIKNDGYDGTGLTVTTLLNPPHIYFLKQRHRNNVIEDVEPVEAKDLLPNGVHLCIKSGTYAEMITNQADFLPKELL